MTRSLIFIVSVLLSAVAADAAAYPRHVNCNGTQKIIPAGATDLYSIGLANSTVNFDSLLIASTTNGGGADLGELLNTVNSIKAAINDASHVTEIQSLWNATWVALAEQVEDDANTYLDSSDNASAQSALFRASSYLQLSGRFNELLAPESLRIYNKSIHLFEKAHSLTTYVARFAKCSTQQIPFKGTYMHAYWCPSSVARPDGKRPTIITVNGYDGTAEIQYYTIARSMVERGYNVLIFEGPGQGSTVRFNKLTFMPNFEVAVTTALDFVLDVFQVDADQLYLWGESFGGYLAPRAFAYEPRFRGLVTNGGVYDFYQAMLCFLPEFLLNLYYTNATAELNSIITTSAKHSLQLTFAINYGFLGFGVSSYSDMLDAFMDYNLADTMDRFANRSVFIYDPEWDTLMGNQSQIFLANTPASTDASLVSLDPYRGAGMHCAVGSTENINIAISRWLESKL
jgi:pimeloyl-ACP methyl ester carboxylesterase